jgi:hypothetical protein
MGVTAEERSELLPSGIYPVYKSRIGWAHDRLKREGLSSSIKRGFWQLTEKGLRYAEANPRLPEVEIRRLARPSSDSAGSDVAVADSSHVEAAAPGSPDDNIRAALEDIQQSLRRNLLDLIADRDPQFFEQLGARATTVSMVSSPSINSAWTRSAFKPSAMTETERWPAKKWTGSSRLFTALALPREYSSPPDASPRALAAQPRAHAERPSR